MTVIRLEEKNISRKQQLAIVFTHPDFKKDNEFLDLYAILKWIIIEKKGPEEYFFELNETVDDAVPIAEVEVLVEIPNNVLHNTFF